MLLAHLEVASASLVGVALVLQYIVRRRSLRKDNSPGSQWTTNSLKLRFMPVYVAVMFSDWLQGPYVYTLYKMYGYEKREIGLLFVIGFGTSAVMGPYIGMIADNMGRRFVCLLFCFMYVFSCIVKHSDNFLALAVGRLLAGGSTSILFSTFDAWLVSEAFSQGVTGEQLDAVFGLMVFSSSCAAIVAGFVASVAVQISGQIGPFRLAAAILIPTSVFIWRFWAENYGKTTRSSAGDSTYRLIEVGGRVLRSPALLCCGLVQSLFESAMYIFVFQWTPTLPPDVDHGLVFACFMAAVMIGSAMSAVFVSCGLDAVKVIKLLLCMGIGTMLVPCFVRDPDAIFASFVLFEVVVGLFYATFFGLRSQIVPDDCRATVLNLYRVPLNVIVVIFCVTADDFANKQIFLFLAVLQLVAFGVVLSGNLSVRQKELTTSAIQMEDQTVASS